MDGPQMVTQCPIPPGFEFLYDFVINDQVGTYWYHSHTGSQYADGLRGLFIIEDDTLIKRLHYDEDISLSVSDYYHQESTEIMAEFLNRYNPTGAEPIPQNSLFNDTKNATWNIKPDTTYLLRIVNMGMFTSQYIYIEDHELTIIEIDGIYVEPVTVKSLFITVAQRYTVLLKTKKKSEKNYRFVNIIDKTMLDFVPDDLQLVSTNWLVYDSDRDLPKPIKYNKFESTIETLNPYNDFDLIPLDKLPLFPDADLQIKLDFTMGNLGDGIGYAFFNDISYVAPKVPTLYTVMSSGKHANKQSIYGSNTNTYILEKGETVDIILNNMDPGKHPFHLHGHAFQLLYRSPEGEDDDDPIIYDPKKVNIDEFPEFPMRRDTIEVNPNGFIIIRFQADNPGVWFFHCHVDWHLEQGLAITLIEAPSEIQEIQSISDNHFDACKLGNISFEGNAAGNLDFFNLEGENLQHKPLPPGFTIIGYIAMGLCSFVAIYGIFSIYKYGIEDVTTENTEQMIKKLYKIVEKYDK